MRYGQKCPGGLFFADDDAGLGLVKQKRFGGAPPLKHKPTHKQKTVVGVPTPEGSTPPPFKETVGSVLLSHNPPVAVPSAQKGLTSRFGKDTGCNPLAKTTNTTKTSNTPNKRAKPKSVKQISTCTNPTHKPPNKGAHQVVLVVNRTVDANTPKNKPPTKTSR